MPREAMQSAIITTADPAIPVSTSPTAAMKAATGDVPHDTGDPDPRPALLHDEVARHLEEEVPDKENPGPEPVHRGAKTQILVHLQRGEPDVDPVQKRHDVQHEQESDEAQRRLLERPSPHLATRHVLHSNLALSACQEPEAG